MTPADARPGADGIGAIPLCPFCIERLERAAEHGHVDAEWAERAKADFARACCSPRDRSLR